jgi:hypothetical protein
MEAEAELEAAGEVPGEVWTRPPPAASEGRGVVQRRRQAGAVEDGTEKHPWTGSTTC